MEAIVEIKDQKEEMPPTGTTVPAHDSMVTVRLSDPVPPNRMSVMSIHKELPKVPVGEETLNYGFDTVTVGSPGVVGVSSSLAKELEDIPESTRERRGSNSSESDDDEGEQVNWEELARTEEKEPRDQGSDDVSLIILSIRYEEDTDCAVYCASLSPIGTGE